MLFCTAGMLGAVSLVVYCTKQSRSTVGEAASVYQELSIALGNRWLKKI